MRKTLITINIVFIIIFVGLGSYGFYLTKALDNDKSATEIVENTNIPKTYVCTLNETYLDEETSQEITNNSKVIIDVNEENVVTKLKLGTITYYDSEEEYNQVINHFNEIEETYESGKEQDRFYIYDYDESTIEERKTYDNFIKEHLNEKYQCELKK